MRYILRYGTTKKCEVVSSESVSKPHQQTRVAVCNYSMGNEFMGFTLVLLVLWPMAMSFLFYTYYFLFTQILRSLLLTEFLNFSQEVRNITRSSTRDPESSPLVVELSRSPSVCWSVSNKNVMHVRNGGLNRYNREVTELCALLVIRNCSDFI